MAAKMKPSDADLPGELWLPVVGLEAYYAISNKGRLKRTGRALTKQSGPTYVGKVLSPPLNSYGYPIAMLCGGIGKRRSVTIHALVAAAFFGPCPVKKEINHIDGNKTNNTVENLEYVTHQENRLHATRVLGHAIGSKNYASKLTEADIPIIRARLAAGEFQRAVAADYGVSQVTISHISKRMVWTHVL